MIIVGASGCGREIADWVEQINAVKPEWEIAGFLDDNLKALEGVRCAYPVIGTIADHVPEQGTGYVMGIASPRIKKMLSMRLEEKGAEFVSVIHPTTIISPSAVIGKGLVTYPNSKIGAGVQLGDFVTLQSTIVGHDVQAEDYVTISSSCGLTGGVRLKRGCFVGDHAAVSIGLTIGEGAYVGIGSVVIRDVDPWKKVFGNPARVIGEVDEW